MITLERSLHSFPLASPPIVYELGEKWDPTRLSLLPRMWKTITNEDNEADEEDVVNLKQIEDRLKTISETSEAREKELGEEIINLKNQLVCEVSVASKLEERQSKSN